MHMVSTGDKIPFEALEKSGASKVKVRYLIQQNLGAKNFFLRQYTVEKGGHTPLDQHAYEHEVYILQGEALVRGGDKKICVKPGDAIFIQSNEVHQFENVSEGPLVFLCVRGADWLYQKDK